MFKSISDLMRDNVLIYFAHLISIRGNYQKSHTTQEKLKDFELFHPEIFFAMRSRILLDIIGYLSDPNSPAT